MSVPDFQLPWSHNPAALLVADAAPVSRAAAATAGALHAVGFVLTAIAIAEAGDDEVLRARAGFWRTTQRTDAILAAQVSAAAGAFVPSVSVLDDGSPRFVLRVDDGSAADAIATEHGGDGVDAELRLFLDEALRNGDRYVDAAPALGFAALSAATVPADVSVIVLCDTARQRTALEKSAHRSDVSGRLTVREETTLEHLPFAPQMNGASTVLHAGSAADVAPLLQSARGPLQRGEIGAVAWRCGRSGDEGRDAESMQVAAAVLGIFGFQHFALADGAQGVELVPAEAIASNTMIFSLSPTFLLRYVE